MGRVIFLFLIISLNIQAQYCSYQASSSPADSIDITKFSIYEGSTLIFSNSSTCSTTGIPATSVLNKYSDFTNLPLKLKKGHTYNFVITVRACPNMSIPNLGNIPGFQDHLYIGFDLYNNKNFNYFSNGSYDHFYADSIVYPFTIPFSSSLSTDCSRIRIAAPRGANDVGFCGTMLMGEVEDYGFCLCEPLTFWNEKYNPLCHNSSDGKSILHITGGTQPYSFKWDNVTSTDAFNYTLSPGTHIVNIIDSNLCTYRDTFTLTNPTKVNSAILVDSTCLNDSIGKITMTPSGGTPPYVYSINNGTYQSSTIFDNLINGFYSLKVKDAHQCVLDTSASIYSKLYPPINFSFHVDSINCYGDQSGQITINTLSGMTPFIYSLDNFNFQSSNNFSNLDSGLYHVKIVDTKNCYKKFNVKLSYPPPITISIDNFTDLTCRGDSNGMIQASSTGGKVPQKYQYLWNTGDTSSKISNLKKATYKLIVQDNYNCKDSMYQAINYKYDSLMLGYQILQKVICLNDTNGIVKLDAVGGASPYQYSIGGLPFSSFDTMKHLRAKQYNLLVKDSNQCISASSVLLPYIIRPMEYSLRQDSFLCYDMTKSYIQVSMKYGQKPYSTNFNSQGWNTDTLINDIPINQKQIIQVKDNQNCVFKDSFTLFKLPRISTTYNIVNNKCYNDAKGKIIVLNSNNGFPPYFHQLNYGVQDGSSSIVYSGLNSAKYVITTSDLKCSYDDTVEVLTTTRYRYATNVRNVSCFNDSNGSVLFVHQGFTTIPKLSIDNSSFSTNSFFTNLKPKLYHFKINYDSICFLDTTISIKNQMKLTTSLNIDSITCHGFKDGKVEVIPSGGTAPYTISFDQAAYTNYSSFDQIAPKNNIRVLTKDFNLCVDTTYVSFRDPPILGVKTIRVQDILCFGDQNGWIEVQGVGGVAPYNYDWLPLNYNSKIENLSSGTYSLNLMDNNKCSVSSTYVIREPALLKVKINVLKDVLCYNQSDGELEAMPEGGTPPYKYVWQMSRNKIVKNLSSGIYYFVLVTDTNGCMDTDGYTFEHRDQLKISLASQNATCFNSSNGHLSVFAKGATPFKRYKNHYLFSLDSVNFGESPQFSFLNPDFYKIFIKDSLGCVFTTETMISSFPNIQVTIDSPIYLSSMTQTIDLQPRLNIDSLILKYQWSPVEGLSCSDCQYPTFSYFKSQSYKLIVSYNNDLCQDSTFTRIVVPASDYQNLFIPNSFSPNSTSNQSENSHFKVYGNNILKVTMSVFNRWGEMVYFNSGIDVAWNGVYNGVLQEPGIYTYSIEVEFLDKIKINRKGTLTLIR